MKQYIPYFSAMILGILLLMQCEKNAGLTTQYQTNFNALGDSITYYKNKLGSQTASVAGLQGEKKTIEKLLLNKDAELKALAKEFVTLKHLTKFGSTLKIDTISIPLDKPIDIANSTNTLELTGKVVEKWYKFDYRITNDSLTISSFAIPAETTVITGFKRNWFLGRQTLTTDVAINNPYIKVIDIKSAEVKVPELWYKKWYVWLGAGIVTGMVLK